MPYTASNAPDHVKKLPAKRQRQWLHIFNGCIADGKEESKCFKMANGVAKDWEPPFVGIDLETAELMFEAKDYLVAAESESEYRVGQKEAGYDPIGASNGKGCANCQWFDTQSGCSVVEGANSPAGLSSLWRPITTPVLDTLVSTREVAVSVPPEPAVTSGRGGLLTGLRNLVGKLGNPGSAHTPVPGAGFRLVKQKDGRARFYTAWSNNFMDREGEIFTKAAHKEFVDWATEHDQYPELWLWHTAGSKFGQVDWLDLTDDGFVHASGLIDAGKEALAERLSGEGSGVSHGFFGLQRENIIEWYRSYEISVLPLNHAAVWTTSFNLLNAGKAIEMGFTPEKRKFFQDQGISEEDIKKWETSAETMAETLKAQGVDSKAIDDLGIQTAPPPTQEEINENNFRTETIKSLMAMQEILTALSSQVKSIDERTKDIKSGDAVVAAAMTPQVGAPVQASKSDDNVVSGDAPQANASRDFFQETVLGGLIGSRT